MEVLENTYRIRNVVMNKREHTRNLRLRARTEFRHNPDSQLVEIRLQLVFPENPIGESEQFAVVVLENCKSLDDLFDVHVVLPRPFEKTRYLRRALGHMAPIALRADL